MVRTIVILVLTAIAAGAQAPLYVIPEGIETRWASPENPRGERAAGGRENAGRKGRPSVPLKAGEQVTLAEVKGASGTVRRIWLTVNDRSPRMLRGLRIDMYWDGAANPAVSAPLGDFFGVGLGRTAAFESALFSNPEGRSFNSVVPMPFRSGMRIMITNESGRDLPMLFYDVDYTLGDKHGADALYFHAHWRRESPTTMQKDYEILPRMEGRGRFIGANLGVISNQQLYFRSWWGEGEVKVYLDGDRELPTLNGTGTEDYIGTGWGQGAYAHRFQGCPIADHDRMQYAFYRYHIPDPVWFRKDVRVTIQQIGYMGKGEMGEMYHAKKPIYKAGAGRVESDKLTEGLFEREDDWSSVAYFYLDRPENGLPKLPAAESRYAGL
jgi:hypothetical protein